MAVGKRFKVLLWLVAIAIVLIFVLYAAVVVLLPKDKIVELVVSRVEKALNRSVSVGDVSARFWGGIGLRLSDLEVRNRDGFDKVNLLELDHLDVGVKFWPLFSKRIEITQISLTGLTVNLERNRAGLLNIEDIGPSTGEGVTKMAPEKAAAAIPFTFDDLRVTESVLHYVDDSSGYSLSFSGIELESRLVPLDDPTVVRSEGRLSAASVAYSERDKSYELPGMTILLVHDALYYADGDSLRVNELRFVLNKLQGRIDGRVTALMTDPLLDFAFRTDELKMQKILDAVPTELVPMVAEMTGSGKVHLAGKYFGLARLTRTASLEAKLTMQDIEIAHERFKGRLDMELAELVFTQMNLTFYSGNAELAGEPLSLKIILDNIPDPSISAEVNMNLNLDVMEELIGEDSDLSGRLLIDATTYGKLNDAESISLLGSMELQDMEYASPDLHTPIRRCNLHVEFLGKDARIEEFRTQIGESDIRLTGSISNLSPYIFALGEVERKPLFVGDIRSSYLDLDALFEETDEGDSDMDTALATAPDTAFFFLPDFDAEGSFEINEGIYSMIAFEDMKGRFELTDYVLHLDSVVGEAYDGDVVVSAVIDIEDFERPGYQVDYEARDIEVNEALSRFTSFDDRLFGKIDLVGSFAATGIEEQEIIRTLRAAGSGRLDKGKLVNFDLAGKIVESFGTKVSKEEKIRSLAGAYRVVDQRVFFDDFAFQTSTGDWNITGSVGFDGSLDYRGKVILSSSASENLDFLGPFKDFLGGSSGDIVVPFRLTGTYSSPKISLDASPATGNTDKRIKDESRKLFDKLFKKN